MSWKPLVLAILAVMLLFPGLGRAQDSGPYKVLKIQLVGGDGGFDYVTADPDGRKLYVARSGPDGHIGVYNLDTLAQVGDIPGVSAHGGAVDTLTGHGFATSKPVTMFDSKTFAILKKIDVQGNPDGYLNDPYNHHFYILSHSEPNITVLDDKDGSILGTIDIGGAPEQAATDGHGKIYVDIEDKAAIAVIDTNTMKMIGRYDVSSKGGGCAGLALDAKNNILFASCRDNKNMIILSATDGHIITDLPIGSGSDGATFNPATMEAFSSQGDGTLTVVQENSPTSFSVEQTVATPARAKVLTLDTKTNQIFTITAEFGPVPAAPAQTAGATPPAGRSAAGRSSLDARPARADDPAFFPDTCDRQVTKETSRYSDVARQTKPIVIRTNARKIHWAATIQPSPPYFRITQVLWATSLTIKITSIMAAGFGFRKSRIATSGVQQCKRRPENYSANRHTAVVPIPSVANQGDGVVVRRHRQAEHVHNPYCQR